MYINGMNNSFIRPGQIIKVPKRDVSLFLTREGDTIQSIANEKGIKIEDLLNYNDNIYLLPNQIIIYRSK